MSPPPDRSLRAEQFRRNQSTQSAWELFSEHRQRIMRLLHELPRPADGRLCLLGAGNANDVDLEQLSRWFAEVHLVDLDESALAAAHGRLPEDARRRTHCHAPVDLSGMLEVLEACAKQGSVTDNEMAQLVAAPLQASWVDLPGPFDAVVSCCLISQLIDLVVQALGSHHPQLLPIILEVRRRHLQLLVHLLAPGGQGMLISDFVASTTFPELMQVPDGSLMRRVRELVEARNFFTGLNPFVLRQQFETDPGLGGVCGDVRMATPWRWNIGPKQFLVTAIAFRRLRADA